MEQEYKPVEWIEGNKISLALPLKKGVFMLPLTY